MCYIKSKLAAIKLEKQEAEKCDSIYVDITTKSNKKLTIGTVYIPPKQHATDDTALYEEISSITQNKEAVIIGDLNCPSIDWNSMYGDQEGKRLVEMVEDTCLTEIVNQKTRENHLLDLVLVTDPDLISDYEVGEKIKWLRPPHNQLQFQNRTQSC